ncbi:hypothetical protein ACOSQ3_026010 [Xanthoceras sorbifolium]
MSCMNCCNEKFMQEKLGNENLVKINLCSYPFKKHIFYEVFSNFFSGFVYGNLMQQLVYYLEMIYVKPAECNLSMQSLELYSIFNFLHLLLSLSCFYNLHILRVFRCMLSSGLCNPSYL